jgi:hypothetical protein
MKNSKQSDETELVPQSEESSGEELDPGCDGGSVGTGTSGKLKTRSKILKAQTEKGAPPPMMSAEGEEEAESLGAGLSFEEAVSSSQSGPRKTSESSYGFPIPPKETAPKSALTLDEEAPRITSMSKRGERNAQQAGAVVDWRKTMVRRQP